jgi:hypothetical protein
MKVYFRKTSINFAALVERFRNACNYEVLAECRVPTLRLPISLVRQTYVGLTLVVSCCCQKFAFADPSPNDITFWSNWIATDFWRSRQDLEYF